MYAERDGVWVLEVEGAVEITKVDEFRTNNVALMKERDDLKQRFDGIEPDDVRKLAEEKRRPEEAQQLKSGEIEVVESRVKGIKADLEKQVLMVTAERDALNTGLLTMQMGNSTIPFAVSHSIHDTLVS